MNYIYALINPLNNKIFYVGKTKSLIKRYKQHLKQIDRNYSKNNIIQLIIENNLQPILMVLEQVSNNWEDREKFYINLYKKDLTNLTEGGENPPLKKSSRIVLLFNKEGKLLQKFSSITECSIKLNIPYNTIVSSCLRENLYKNKYYFLYEECYLSKGLQLKKYKINCGPKYKYKVIDRENNIFNFKTKEEASNFTKDSIRTITRYCNKLQNSFSNRGFQYKKGRRLSQEV